MKKKRVWLRILALFLVLTMVVGYWASAITNIKIASDASNAAMSYLADSTEYVNAGRTERFADLVRSFRGEDTLEDCYRQASIKIGAAKYEEALYFINKCLDKSSPVQSRETYIDALTKKGCLLTLLGRDEEAIESLKLALATEPTLSDVYLVLAQIYLNRNQVAELESTVEGYLEIVPEDLDMRVTYMQTLAAEGKDEEASEQGYMIVENSESTASQQEDSYYVIAINYFKQENFEAALENLNKVIDQDGKYTDLYYDKGICYLSMGELESAVDAFSESIDKGMSVQNCYYSRAVTEFTKENADYEAAYKDLVAARDYQGEDRDEETVAMAEEFLDAAYVIQNSED